MKFMKLGSKPDALQSEGNSIRHVSSELAPDVIVSVGEVKFYLHKFPLLSKSNYLQKLIVKADEESSDEIHLADFPGGPKAFEICARFCYGMTVTLNAYNVVAARCAAEYLEMTEDVDRGNLIFKIEIFLNSGILCSWKDSIIVLQTTKSLLPLSEDLKIVGRCIDSIASKTSVDPSNVTWSYTYNRKLTIPDRIVEVGIKFQEKVPKDWWVEDICELDLDLYKRVMMAVRSRGRMKGNVIGEALKSYLVRWLPNSIDALASEAHNKRNKSLVETVIYLLPSDKDAGCLCSFLVKLLKFAILFGADDASKEDLMNRIGLKLDEASVNDLLIPARSPQTTKYDIELVQSLVHRFMVHKSRTRDLNIAEKNELISADFVLGHVSWLNVGKLIDGYLAEIAKDPNLTISSFVLLSESIPKSARPIHDGLYGAIDVYLKEHPNLTKTEKKKICGLMDVKKLTLDTSMRAAQNERLPLRVVVRILFFEQVRAAAGAQALSNQPREDPHCVANNEEDWGKKKAGKGSEGNSLREQMSQVKMIDGCKPKNGKLATKDAKNRGSVTQLLPSRSRKIFDKLWVVGKGHGEAENKSSETSGSSQSPTSMIHGETKSSGSLSRHRRYSIS
ncbi:BTB/POZ domain-containing protein NPY1-like [Diospyros lotus]|uniref:BTB/POZ domain-containing protein NPY1-like n=1 Tax=Diospyros lotus TaxID=55363 RepID=UPI00224CFAF4|nr:BTB/POZ domain-containing protein NPY1-like [Diospyros lotus]